MFPMLQSEWYQYVFESLLIKNHLKSKQLLTLTIRKIAIILVFP